MQTPQYKIKQTLSLYVPGELLRNRLVFKKAVILYASPNNPGARALAAELEQAYPGISTTEDPQHISVMRRGAVDISSAAAATHFLLYLNSRTYMDAAGDRLAEELRRARTAKLTIVMAHENVPELGGCEFALFFTTTPKVHLFQSQR